MSLEAMVWALKRAPIPENEPLAHLVLIGLADHARDDGTGSRPSARTLAEYARCSVRSVHNKIKVLQAAGLIVPGDQREVGHLRADRRPKVWSLTLDNGVQQVHTVGVHGVNGMTARGERDDVTGCTVVPNGVHAGADRTVLEPSLEPSLNLGTSTPEDSGDLFDVFWQVYPRRAGKKDARKAWDKATKDADPHVILDGALRYSEDPNREDAFTAHPSTWLNQGRWDDDPQPARSSGGGYASRQDEVLARERERARAADAAAAAGVRQITAGGVR